MKKSFCKVKNTEFTRVQKWCWSENTEMIPRGRIHRYRGCIGVVRENGCFSHQHYCTRCKSILSWIFFPTWQIFARIGKIYSMSDDLQTTQTSTLFLTPWNYLLRHPSIPMGKTEDISHYRSIVRHEIIGNECQLHGLHSYRVEEEKKIRLYWKIITYTPSLLEF